MTQGINREVAREALSPDPSQLLEFFLIYYNYSQDQNSVLAFTPMQKGIGQKITWQGVDYLPLPIRSEGFSSKGDNELPRPKLQISNAELILSKYLKIYNNFVGAKIIRKRTFAKFLDDENFENGENPFFDLSMQASTADLNSQLPDEVFYINRRVTETKEFVEFELSTVFEMDNVFIPNRMFTQDIALGFIDVTGADIMAIPKQQVVQKLYRLFWKCCNPHNKQRVMEKYPSVQ